MFQEQSLRLCFTTDEYIYLIAKYLYHISDIEQILYFTFSVAGLVLKLLLLQSLQNHELLLLENVKT